MNIQQLSHVSSLHTWSTSGKSYEVTKDEDNSFDEYEKTTENYSTRQKNIQFPPDHAGL